MKVGLHFVNFDLPGGTSTLAATARAADDGGFSTFTLMDHWFQMDEFAVAQDPMVEGYTTLGYLAGQTERLRLGLMVTGVTYRHPGLLAKIVTTLDVLSGGRAQLGIGALRICHQMWSDDDGPYDGTHYHLAETICSPRPIQQPRPKILIGGGGERKTLRLVARYADSCNLFAPTPEVVAHKLGVLARHCDAEGRDPADIERTILGFANPLDDIEAFVTDMARYASLGIDLGELMPLVPDPADWASQVGERVVPRLAELESPG